MKEVSSSIVKIVVTLSIAYCFITPGKDTILPDFVKSPFGDIKQSFFNFIKPRIERHVVQAPEAFMTSVFFKLIEFKFNLIDLGFNFLAGSYRQPWISS